MPEHAHAALLRMLVAKQPLPVLTQGLAPPDLSRVRTVPPARSLGELCALVAGASLIVSTDTAIVHLADAFESPCVAVFTTHRPEWRVRDYPLCRPVHRPPALPEAIEFARRPEDVAIAQAAWGEDLSWLEAALDRAIAEFVH
jgi:ADP-heptose:LPS heptosyltransferase